MGSWVVPKHCFTTWQLVVDCLPTQDRLMKSRILPESRFNFCNASRENAQHLFLDCSFTLSIWRKVKAFIGLGTMVFHSQREWFCLLHFCGKKNQPSESRKVYLSAMIYAVWRERNSRRFENIF